ncbi:hypothetical protein VPHK24_0012 [Vibrio phage K24]|nr:hypothetical protein SIPHO078v2_p0011 [Vibrio phage 14E30.1]QZI92459.1 hypothetical protein SIPHO058v2_p0011 [Vibrio phage 14E30.2]
MNYEDMSDFEINAAVTCIVHECHGWEINWTNSCFFHCGVDGSGYYSQSIVDYCNNPSDAWPIILKHGISITFDGIDWEADTAWMGCEDINRSYNNIEKNAGKPLRAAMICFLKMKDAEK